MTKMEWRRLTAHRLKVEQDLGDDNGCVEHHQQTEDHLNWNIISRQKIT